MRRLLLLLVPAVVAALVLTGNAMAAPGAKRPKRTAAPLVKRMSADGFTNVLATKTFQALYYFTPEKRNRGKILCTGGCVDAWPILFVPKGVTVPRKIKGYSGTWGTIKRPEGGRQLTYNGLPLYTYAHEGPREVKCDNVGGWFVIRL
jgi:predicted lipoprotein with Yx(FWY)xxD motif